MAGGGGGVGGGVGGGGFGIRPARPPRPILLICVHFVGPHWKPERRKDEQAAVIQSCLGVLLDALLAALLASASCTGEETLQRPGPMQPKGVTSVILSICCSFFP